MVLFEYLPTGPVPLHPASAPGAPAEEDLRAIPGAWEAYNGLAALKLNVCKAVGAQIDIDAAVIAEFQSAPANVRDEIAMAEKAHGDEAMTAQRSDTVMVVSTESVNWLRTDAGRARQGWYLPSFCHCSISICR